jgi:uncharacterized membrane protein
MVQKAAITVNRSREEVQRLWQSWEHRTEDLEAMGATVTFVNAPGDRGTEIHVALEHDPPGGPIGEVVEKITGATRLAKIKDELRRFKQEVETGVIPRSEGSPEGESAERKLKQRPAQPLSEAELQKVGV